jgi:dihydrofolate reductase
VARFKQLTDEYPFDVVVGDETYELVGTFAKDPALKRSPFVVISDFVGLDMPATTRWSGSWSMP